MHECCRRRPYFRCFRNRIPNLDRANVLCAIDYRFADVYPSIHEMLGDICVNNWQSSPHNDVDERGIHTRNHLRP
jgi:hypothetical protein